jgi:hypothetical protein
MPEHESGLRVDALYRVSYAYSIALSMRSANLSAINAARPPDLRYSSQAELVREFWHAANAISTFAVQLELISPQDARELLAYFGSVLEGTMRR